MAPLIALYLKYQLSYAAALLTPSSFSFSLPMQKVWEYGVGMFVNFLGGLLRAAAAELPAALLCLFFLLRYMPYPHIPILYA